MDEEEDTSFTRMPSTSTTAPAIVLVDDDDDVQVCSPRSFAQAKCSKEKKKPSQEEFSQHRLGSTGAKAKKRNLNAGHLLKGRQHRKRVMPADATIDLTTAASDDCEVLFEKKTKRKCESPTPASKDVSLTCAICYDSMKNETSTVCGHIFCGSCILSAIKVQKKCPTCRRKLTSSMIHRIYLCGSSC